MARKAILETGYTFTPGAAGVGSVIIPRAIQRERLILITNVTTNTVIYNFSDQNLKATSYTVNGISDTTTVVLNYNTSGGMLSTDRLQIIVDEYEERIVPSETLMDPVGKMRVSTPQALIDTDFEYGTQPTKWETATLLNNRPTAFYDVTAPITITAIAGAGTRTVTVTSTANPGVGVPIFVQDATDPIANGWQLTETSTVSNFTYVARANVTNASILDASKTFVFGGSFFTGAAIPLSGLLSAAFTTGSTTLTCTTIGPHGLSVGDGIFIRNTTAATSNPPNGAFFVATTPTSNTFTFIVDIAPVGAITATGGVDNLFARPYTSSIHRPFDGGVGFSAGTPYHGNQLIRQTRRYFRYQSGKGIQFSTGTNLKPALSTDRLTASGTTVTVTCKFPHNLGPGAVITVSGANETAYNGNFTVATVPSDLTLTYTAGSAPTSPATGFPITISPFSWHGSRIRIGMFDEQNGFFYELDGQNFYAVRRSSTDQLSGTLSVTNVFGSAATVTGTNTTFSSQLKPGDYVVIRGMSYLVLSIASDTSMFISPEYRGPAISGVIASKRTDTRVAQSQFNIDKVDGTGPSGYNLDLQKMQMLYMDYSWYGAGAIRYGFKNQRGEIIYAHRTPNANYRTEAYMRSGNLPARYECTTIAPITHLTAAWSIGTGTGSITVNDTSQFPPSGTLVIRAAGGTLTAIEYVTYSSKTATSFTLSARGVTNLTGPGGLTGGGGGAATTFTFSTTAPVSVELYSPQASATISHWGSSVIMDGRYDDDKSFLFTSGMPTAVSVGAGATNALLSLRLAPSVDSGLTGTLGQRDLINRMQLTLRSMGIISTGNCLISIVLNGRVGAAGTFAAAGGSSLSQICLHTAGTTITGGETIFSYFVGPGVFSQDLTLVRDLGNSILGGGTTSLAPTTVSNVYPDGPDIVTIVSRNLNTVGITTINARLSWTEAQA
jgi:hypothetical protein